MNKALGPSGEASSEVVTAVFEIPLLAHACMEPLNCTVHVTPTTAGGFDRHYREVSVERVRAAGRQGRRSA